MQDRNDEVPIQNVAIEMESRRRSREYATLEQTWWATGCRWEEWKGEKYYLSAWMKYYDQEKKYKGRSKLNRGQW